MTEQDGSGFESQLYGELLQPPPTLEEVSRPDLYLASLQDQRRSGEGVRLTPTDGAAKVPLEAVRGDPAIMDAETLEDFERYLALSRSTRELQRRRRSSPGAIDSRLYTKAYWRPRAARRPFSIERFTRGGTVFAALLAGRQRPHLRTEWAAMLHGDGDREISATRRLVYVVGFMWAAVRMRAHDLGGPLWRPVDWLLATENRTNSLVTAIVGVLAIYLAATDGVHALLTDGWEPCAILGAALFGLARWLRRLRGIELAGDTGDDS